MFRGLKRRHLWSALVAGLLALVMAQGLYAHQQKVAISQVLINERSGNIEIYHRFYLHDAEHSIRHLFGKGADIMRDAKTQQRFADYVARGFQLQNLKGQDLKPRLLGYEVEGKFFYVYQETKIPPALKGLQIRQPALQDIWSQQVNTVNIEGRGPLQSLLFEAGDRLSSIAFR